jgi:hypothetical protein
MADEILIGFDAREAGEHDPRWDDDERRELFLLRRDVARPLSVDRAAWPTVFDIWYSHRNRQFGPPGPRGSGIGGVSAASRFPTVANERVPEHAPFHVYSLYGLE